MNLKESKTLKNLAQAYAGECQARTRYEFIEYGARMQGYNALAEVVDKVVYNEFNHARMFYTKIQDGSNEPINNIDICGGFPFREKWTLVENLKHASLDEQGETLLYPKFAKTATAEGFNDIAKLFNDIAKIEEKHKKLFLELHENLKNGTLYSKDKEITWKCTGCGYTVKGKEAPKVCPVCQAKQGVFAIPLKNQI
jgi:rubrerythrin